MVGKHEIEIHGQNIRYKFTIENKLSLLRGSSGTGKTTLVDLVKMHRISDKYVKIASDLSVKTFSDADTLGGIEEQINNSSETLFICDETLEVLRSYEFASAVNKSDNYFLFITRDNMRGMKINTEAIYEITYNIKSNTNMFKQIHD